MLKKGDTIAVFGKPGRLRIIGFAAEWREPGGTWQLLAGATRFHASQSAAHLALSIFARSRDGEIETRVKSIGQREE